MKKHDVPELLVVIPVYNEQASVKKVIQEWIEDDLTPINGTVEK